jgi:hypothetical protein
MLYHLNPRDQVRPALEPPVGPPKINSNSTSITSSANALPVKTLVPSKSCFPDVLHLKRQ